MLPGFEEYTEHLTDKEKAFIPLFVNGFIKRVGKDNAITNRQIVEFYSKKGITIREVTVRKIINFIRNNGLVPGLVASSHGYYITRDISDVSRYIESLEGRESQIRKVKLKMKEYLNELMK